MVLSAQRRSDSISREPQLQLIGGEQLAGASAIKATATRCRSMYENSYC